MPKVLSTFDPAGYGSCYHTNGTVRWVFGKKVKFTGNIGGQMQKIVIITRNKRKWLLYYCLWTGIFIDLDMELYCVFNTKPSTRKSQSTPSLLYNESVYQISCSDYENKFFAWKMYAMFTSQQRKTTTHHSSTIVLNLSYSVCYDLCVKMYFAMLYYSDVTL